MLNKFNLPVHFDWELSTVSKFSILILDVAFLVKFIKLAIATSLVFYSVVTFKTAALSPVPAIALKVFANLLLNMLASAAFASAYLGLLIFASINWSSFSIFLRLLNDTCKLLVISGMGLNSLIKAMISSIL